MKFWKEEQRLMESLTSHPETLVWLKEIEKLVETKHGLFSKQYFTSWRVYGKILSHYAALWSHSQHPVADLESLMASRPAKKLRWRAEENRNKQRFTLAPVTSVAASECNDIPRIMAVSSLLPPQTHTNLFHICQLHTEKGTLEDILSKITKLAKPNLAHPL